MQPPHSKSTPGHSSALLIMTLNKVLYILVSQTVNEQKDQTEMSLLHKLPVCSWLRLQCERSHLLAYKKASSNLVLEIIWQATER